MAFLLLTLTRALLPSLLRSAGSLTDIAWTDVRVGNVIVVRDDELFPADLMCLYSALAEKVCFIKTTNLDGETNLKIRKPLDFKGVPVRRAARWCVSHVRLRTCALIALHAFRSFIHSAALSLYLLCFPYMCSFPAGAGGELGRCDELEDHPDGRRGQQEPAQVQGQGLIFRRAPARDATEPWGQGGHRGSR